MPTCQNKIKPHKPRGSLLSLLLVKVTVWLPSGYGRPQQNSTITHKATMLGSLFCISNKKVAFLTISHFMKEPHVTIHTWPSTKQTSKASHPTIPLITDFTHLNSLNAVHFQIWQAYYSSQPIDIKKELRDIFVFKECANEYSRVLLPFFLHGLLWSIKKVEQCYSTLKNNNDKC